MADKKHILIAEDEKPMAKALELKFINAGYDVTVAYDGEELLKATDAGGIDLILLDLMMPRLDGFGVLEKLKEKGSTIPVIISSNLGQPEDQKRAEDLGAVDFFVKSDTPISEVISHVEKVLGS